MPMSDDDGSSLLRHAVAALHRGGMETLRRPPAFACAAQTHEPFRLMETPGIGGPEEQPSLWGYVRTSSWQFEGERTDIHDVFSLAWASLLRAFGLASPYLIDEPNEFGPRGELSGRFIHLQQCPWAITVDSFVDARNAMNAWTAFGFHLLDSVFEWSRIERVDLLSTRTTTECMPDWVTPVMRDLGQPDDAQLNARKHPLWIYFASHKKGVTIVRMAKRRLTVLKSILAPFRPSTVVGEKALVVFANGIPNAVPKSAISKAKRLLLRIGDSPEEAWLLPIDSHCIVLGSKTLLAIRANCGREIYERERQLFLNRRKRENGVFFSESFVEWLTPVDPGDLESACVDLLEREPGVLRAKAVGSVNDRDGGRDILIDWLVPSPHDSESDQRARSQSIRVIAQVKSRSKSVGKRDVQDIRDTLDRYGARGFLLIAYPRVTTAVVDYLEDMREKLGPSTDWWEARQIEERLRRHPDIANRYPNLVRLKPAA